MDLNIRPLCEIKDKLFNVENYPTKSSNEQVEVEKLVLSKYEELYTKFNLNQELPELYKYKHRRYLYESTFQLSSVNEALDASRTWLCYWITHSLSLLGTQLDIPRKRAMMNFLAKCQSPDGGFGGGPGQLPHLATTYAAVNALVILGSDALGVINSCQTYEGGFSGCPGMEAHGGYAFCGLAALVILNKGHLIDERALLRWLVNKQMKLEGGFQGRTNKLVDGCYSFWQGGAFPLIYSILNSAGNPPQTHLFNHISLQEYLLVCCQNINGGLIDKPGKRRDLYHTCYTLSGLSIAQRFLNNSYVLGTKNNELLSTHPLYNIRPEYVRKALIYFNELGLPSDENTRT